MMMALPLLFALSAPPQGCRAIQAEMILARDVAAAIPDFAQVPADFRLGYLPGSGAPRILHGVDLQRIAKNQGVKLAGLPDVCFSRQTFIPQPEDIRVAIRTTLADVPGIAAARIEIGSSSQHPAPFGKLIFPRSGLQLPSGTNAEALWRGFVRYAEGDFPVWARVRILADRTRVVALANIPTGKVIQKSQVRLESCEDSLLDETTAHNLDEVIGFIPKSFLRAYLPIRKAQLAAPPDIAKGELVDVQVNSGAAHLVIQGKAQSEGIHGSTILIRNLSSGKDFPARVVGKNQAVVGDLVP
jgi:flagella basal body P-ring formation protein FlgA